MLNNKKKYHIILVYNKKKNVFVYIKLLYSNQEKKMFSSLIKIIFFLILRGCNTALRFFYLSCAFYGTNHTPHSHDCDSPVEFGA